MDTIDVPLELTQELIDAGIREDCGKCPIALAFAIACPGASDIKATIMHVSFIAGAARHQVELPWEAYNVIDAFDDGFAVTPRTLVIPIPRSIASLPGFLADESLLAPLALEPMPL